VLKKIYAKHRVPLSKTESNVRLCSLKQAQISYWINSYTSSYNFSWGVPPNFEKTVCLMWKKAVDLWSGSGVSNVQPAGAFHMSPGFGFKMYCIRPPKLGLRFCVGTTALSCYLTFLVAFWSAESEYAHDSLCKRMILLQTVCEIPGLC